MQETSDRRKFLKAAASSAVLGFPFLCSCTGGGGETADGQAAELLAQARRRMRDEIKPGVVLLIPADQEQRSIMAAALGDLLGASAKVRDWKRKTFGAPGGRQPVDDGGTAAQRLFYQAIFVCIAEEHARREFPGLRSDTRAVLLGLDGKPVDQLRGDLSLYQKDFAERMGRFIHGDRGERLRPVVEAQRAALGEEAARQCDADLKNLDADRFLVREAACERLAEIAPRVPALLEATLREKPCLEVRRRVERLLDGVYAQMPEKAGARLPYGVEWRQKALPPCPGCGRASLSPPALHFLHHYTDSRSKRER